MRMRPGAAGRSLLAGAVLACGACWAADPATPPPMPSAPAPPPPPEPKVGPAGGTIGRSMSDSPGGLLRSETMRSGATANIERRAAPAAKAKARAADPTEPADTPPRSDPPRVRP
ncbi:hypothetical protein [Variovorax davisae]|uniref:hypothetical protein n=1 Tax=Variovorax davisae TaxID=3053515 RepID=UPI0025782F64|nr:hypothetical protein [Variovorax sp. J22P271]